MKVEELFENQVEEGIGDYIGGVASHVGGKFIDKMREKGRRIVEPIRQAHEAGKRASAIGNEMRADRKERMTAEQAKIRAQQDLPKVIRQLAQVVAQSREANRRLQAMPTNEGLWDYLRGSASGVGQAAKKVGGAIKQQAQQVHAKGQRTSAQSDIARLNAQQQQLAARLYQISKLLGVDARKEINKLLTTGGKINPIQQGVLKAYNAYANTQQPPQPQQQPPTQPPAGGWNRDNMELEPRP